MATKCTIDPLKVCLTACLFTSLNCTEKCSCSACWISVSPPFMRQPSLSRAMKFFVYLLLGLSHLLYLTRYLETVLLFLAKISTSLIRRQHLNTTFLRQKGALQWPGKPHLKWLNQSLPSFYRQGTCHQPISPSPSTSMLINFSKSHLKNCWMTEKEIFL